MAQLQRKVHHDNGCKGRDLTPRRPVDGGMQLERSSSRTQCGALRDLSGCRACSRRDFDRSNLGMQPDAARTSEVQGRLVSWSDSQIEFELNQGGFTSLSGLYLWVITGDGRAARAGQFAP